MNRGQHGLQLSIAHGHEQGQAPCADAQGTAAAHMQVIGADGILAKAQIYAERPPAAGYGTNDGSAKLTGQTDQGRAGLGRQVQTGTPGLQNSVSPWTQGG